MVALGRFDAITGIGEETTCSSEQAVAVMSHPYERGRDVRPLFFVAPRSACDGGKPPAVLMRMVLAAHHSLTSASGYTYTARSY